MFLKHFGLTANPFGINPQLNFLYRSTAFEESMAHLVYGLDNSEAIIMITGPIGSGKTMAVQSFLTNLGDTYRSALVTNTQVSTVELLKLILEDLDVPVERGSDKSDLLIAFKKVLLESYREGQRVIVVIDEAQNLTPEVLEEVRLLTNLGQGAEQPVQLVLVGQPELKVLVDRPDLAQLRQRIRVHYEVENLDYDEMVAYIRHRMQVAGCPHQVFQSEALDLLYALSGGVPRLVNTFAGDALLSAFVGQREFVTRRDVEEGVRSSGMDRDEDVRARAEAVARARARERERAGAAAPLQVTEDAGDEEQARAEAATKAQAEEQARREAAAKAQAQEQARAEAAAKARAEEQARAEAAAKVRAEEQVRAEAAAKARAEEQARREAAAKARAEEQVRADAAAKVRAEEQARAEAAAKARAQEQARADAEARARDEAAVAAARPVAAAGRAQPARSDGQGDQVYAQRRHRGAESSWGRTLGVIFLLIVAAFVTWYLVLDKQGDQGQGGSRARRASGSVTAAVPGAGPAAAQAAEEDIGDVPLRSVADRTEPEAAADPEGGAAPVAAPVAAPGEAYFIHVASFRERSRAERYQADLAGQDLASRVDVEPVSGADWNRVYLGPFADRETARVEAESLLATGEIRYYRIILRAGPGERQTAGTADSAAGE